MSTLLISLLSVLLINFTSCEKDTASAPEKEPAQDLTYPIVETQVKSAYSDIAIISLPSMEDAYYGQDANHNGNQPSYTDNGDGTVSDNVTGLIWEKEMGSKISYKEAFQKAESSDLGGYSDWRVPSIKELYSLILFTGQVKGAAAIEKFIDTTLAPSVQSQLPPSHCHTLHFLGLFLVLLLPFHPFRHLRRITHFLT